MNFHTAAEVKGQSIGLVTAIHDRESQTSKLVMDYVLLQIVGKDEFPGYPCCCSSDSGAFRIQLCDPTHSCCYSLGEKAGIDIPPIKCNIAQCSVDPFIHAYYFTLGWHSIFKSGGEYYSLHFVLKCFPLFK